MTIYHQKIRAFVKAKELRIKSVGVKILYAKKADYEEINTWTDEEAKRVWKHIEHIYHSGIGSSSCPWCIYNNSNCGICDYGKRHGICDSFSIFYTYENDFSKIIKGIRKRVERTNVLFPSDYYKNLIEFINSLEQNK